MADLTAAHSTQKRQFFRAAILAYMIVTKLAFQATLTAKIVDDLVKALLKFAKHHEREKCRELQITSFNSRSHFEYNNL